MKLGGIFLCSILISLSALTSGAASTSTDPNKKTYDFPFNGRIYTDHYLYTQGNQAGEFEQNSYSLWLELDSRTNRGFGAHIVGQADALPNSPDSPHQYSWNYQIREGYLSNTTEGTDLRIGQQIIPWGKSDGVNPTDYFSAKNYVVMNPDEEVKRIGAPAANFLFTPQSGTSPLSFQFVFQAFYPQTKMLIPDAAIPTGLAFSRDPPPPSAFSPDAMEYGLKIAYLKSNYDLSLSFFHGFSHMAEYVFDPAQGLIYAINPALNAVGGDLSFTLGDYIFRGESALLLPENGSDQDPLFGLVEPDHWDSVIGIERPFFTDFRIQFQMLYRYHLYFISPNSYSNPNPTMTRIQQGVGNGNALILNYLDQSTLGTTFRFAYANETSNWTADLFLIGYFGSGQDYLIRPQIGYKPIEGIRLTTGADLYGGSINRPLGALKDKSAYFLEAKYTF